MKNRALSMFFIILICFYYSIAWSESELVKGWYDSSNDWFVFEWQREGAGMRKTIWDSPNKIMPVINSAIDYNADNNVFVYSYDISNGFDAKQPIDDIVIEHFDEISQVSIPYPENEWYLGKYLGRNNALRWSKTGGEIAGIPSGQIIYGLSFNSQGMPAIVNSIFVGKKRSRFAGAGDYDSEEVIESFERVYAAFEKEYPEKFKDVTLKTLGPTAPPAELDPAAFLKGIIDMKHETYALGWITNEGIEKSLDAKLDSALKKLQGGQNNAAANVLKAFINEVEAQGCASYEDCPAGKHLKPEAYGLLKYNAQYLIDNLK